MLKTFGTPPLFMEATGQWPPEVVGLHGWARDRNDFRAAFHGLPAAAIDFPGFGMTPAPEEPWDTRRYGQQVAAFLRDVGQPVVLVGHSFGGRVAVRIARDEPQLVRGLVLSGAPIMRIDRPARRPAAAYRLIRRANQLGLLSDARLEQARQRYGSADYAAAQGVMREILVGVLQEEYEDDLRRIDHPVTLLWGEGDRDVPVEVARAAHGALPHSEVITVPGTGHGLVWDRPDALRSAIDGMLAR